MLCFPGKESTLFVVLFVNRYEYEYEYNNEDFQRCISTIEGCVKEKLPLIPHTKLLIIDASSKMMKKKRNSPRNSSGLFAKRECSRHVPRASEQALQVIGPYCSNDGIEKDCSVKTLPLLPLLFF